jgi:hypothetical protein
MQKINFTDDKKCRIINFPQTRTIHWKKVPISGILTHKTASGWQLNQATATQAWWKT